MTAPDRSTTPRAAVSRPPLARAARPAGAAETLLLLPLRFAAFVWFSLLEYTRSGRIWIEVGTAILVFVVFLRGDLDAAKFFTVLGLYTPLLTLYTVSTFITMGNRPPGYLILTRAVGRYSYLTGLYVAGVLVVSGVYLLLSLATLLVSNVAGMNAAEWLLGSLPLLLNVLLLGALMLLLSSLVLPMGGRLAVLAMVAIAFSTNFWGNATLDALPAVLRGILDGVQTLLAYPLAPGLSGYALAVDRTYDSLLALATLGSQILLTLLLLALALLAVSRHELRLSAD